jgi:hypothetical protein
VTGPAPQRTLHAVRNLASTFVLGALVSLAAAQPRLGDQAPEVPFKEVVQGDYASLSAMRGKLVMVDLFATW